jgi:hypothetical protein
MTILPFEEACTTAPGIDTDKNQEVLDLTLDELNYVAGGYDWIKAIFAG